MGKSSSTIKIALVFLECVRDEGATDQMVISDKVAGISNCISPDNLTIRAEKIIGPRLDYVLFTFFMPSILPFEITTQLEMVVHIQQSGISQYGGDLHISPRLNGIEVEVEI